MLRQGDKSLAFIQEIVRKSDEGKIIQFQRIGTE